MMLATSPARQRPPADLASEKRSLASILREQGPLSVTDAVDIALDVCDELANAHGNGVVHGDLGLHRVRTYWPRIPKERVDIFALGEDDSAAFALRASAVAILVAPEQREGRVVDRRADVWAVGALLHWMIAGVPPSTDPVERTLARAPRTLIVTVEACLAEDPSKRPLSVDEIAEVIGSFASSPPERFEQLARRRMALENSKRVRTDLGDVDRVLGRLDDAAIERELALATEPPAPVAPVEPAIDRLIFAVNKNTGSAIFDASTRMTDLVDDQQDVETVLAQPRYEPGAPIADAIEPVASPLSIAPVILSSALLAPPKQPPPAVITAPVAPVQAPKTLSTKPKTNPLTVGLAVIGAVAAVSLGVGIGMRLVERATARGAPVAAPLASTSTPAVPLASTSTPAAIAAAPSSPPKEPAPSVTAPAALPVITPASLPDARIATPASLPDARPALSPRAAAPPKPAPREESAAKAFEATPSSLSDALR